MAMQLIFMCKECGFEVEAWDEGNPYIEGPDGKRHHYYHPCRESGMAAMVSEILGREPTETEVDDMMRNHGGNEADHICLDCGGRSLRNDREARAPCAACGGTQVVDAYHLAGRSCPSCKEGKFGEGQMGAIS